MIDFRSICQYIQLNILHYISILYCDSKFPMEEATNVSHYKALSEEMGAIVNGTFVPYPLALRPFITSKSVNDYYRQLHQIWQRVLLRVAKDHHFLLNLLSPLTEENTILKQNLKILRKMEGRQLKEGICVDRIDYYQDISGPSVQPKLTQYNLLCVGHQAPSEKYQTKRRLVENDESYFSNAIAPNCTNAICELIKITKKQGIALYVVHQPKKLEIKKDMNYLDWVAFTEEFAKHSVKMIPTNMKLMAENLTLRNNGDLFYGEERVAVVYYRTVYRVADYTFGNEGDFERSFAAKEMICKSNAFSIPPVEFELANLKRVQTELGKPEVLRRYASQAEAEMLSKTRVGQWDFDEITEQELSALTARVEANPEGYILKPNMEGGSNNIYGADIISKLRGDREKLRSYILMEKINIKIYKNSAIIGQNVSQQQDDYYEIGLFGTLTWASNEIVSNKADGAFIRAKPITVKQGFITKGTVSIASWKLDQN